MTDDAKRAMADPTSKGEFYEDILCIEHIRPGQPHLTIVDFAKLETRPTTNINTLELPEGSCLFAR